VQIYDRLSEKNVLFLASSTRAETIKALIKVAAEDGLITDAKAFEDAVLEREVVISTGVGRGVAVPHAKLASIDQFFISIGIAKDAIEWEAIDGRGVRIVFLIGGPESRQKEYLTILAKLMLVIKNPAIREELLAAATPGAVLQPFLRV